jgi:hypothetical protein
MAYEGETIRIIARALDFDGNPIVPVDVTSVVINLYDGLGNYVFLAEPMVYQASDPENATLTPYWYYDWQDILVGSWIAQCVFTGLSYELYEYVTVKVKAAKIVPTGQPTPIS